MRLVGGHDDLAALELLEVAVAGRRHRATQGADQVGLAVDRGGRAVEDLLERADLADVHATAAGQLGVVSLGAPVVAAAGHVGGAREGGTYIKLERKIGDYANAGVAVHLSFDNGTVGRAGIALTGVVLARGTRA